MKKGVLKSFAKFTGKYLCQSLFFNNVAGLTPATLFKKRLWHRCFPVNFCEICKNTFFTELFWMTGSVIPSFIFYNDAFRNHCVADMTKIHEKSTKRQQLKFQYRKVFLYYKKMAKPLRVWVK